jgi:predicted aspartyl protease
MRTFSLMSVAICLLLTIICAQRTVAQKTPAKAASQVKDQVTVPLIVEGNRPFIELTFYRADGSKRSARFLIDSGGGGFLLSEPLARDLGLTWGEVSEEEGKKFAAAKTIPRVSVGEFDVQLNPERVAVVIGSDNLAPKGAPGHADGLFPGHVLAQYHVVFDYPKGTFTLARTGILTPKGDALPMPVGKRSGFPRTEIEVAGKTYGFLIDTGASFTMVSEVLLKSLGSDHQDWERHAGAFGEAATLGGQTLETMFIPAARWGPRQLERFGVVSQREGTFERFMSSMMTAPIVGSLAGNVLKRFRVELDYQNNKLYLSAP